VGQATSLGAPYRGIRCRTHDDQPAAVCRNSRVDTLVEQDRVVLDVAVPTEPQVSDAAAVTRAHIPAHPVIGELVEVGARGEGDAACPSRRGGEQLVS